MEFEAARVQKTESPSFIVVPLRYMTYIPGSTFLENNRIEGGKFAIQSCELIETKIGKRDTNGEE